MMSNDRCRTAALAGVMSLSLLVMGASSPALADAKRELAPGGVPRDGNGNPVLGATDQTQYAQLAADGSVAGGQGAISSVKGPRPIRDPLEKFNRGVYKINTKLDRYFLKPIAQAYLAVVPGVVRRAISHGLNNVQEPFTMVNALLQGKPEVALKSFGRFLVNSTVGIGGLRDQASKWGVKPQEEDFGQTLGVWGVGDNPFLMLPFFGPSNPRDAVGIGVEYIADPFSIVLRNTVKYYYRYSLTALRVVDLRAGLLTSADRLLATSEDPYVALRSAYYQQRRFEVSDGAIDFGGASDSEFYEDAPAVPPAEAQPPADQQTPSGTEPQPQQTVSADADPNAQADATAAAAIAQESTVPQAEPVAAPADAAPAGLAAPLP